MVTQRDQAEVSLGEIDRVVAGTHHDPHSILGAHPGPGGVTVRVLRPLAKTVTVVLPDGRRFPAEHAHEGVFAATLPLGDVPDYRVAVSYPDGNGGPLPELVTDDPYRFLPTLGEMDLHLIGEGRHENLWQVLGAHVRQYGPVTGTAFAVWAPNARGVRVIGDFNHWDGRGHPMRSLGGAGVWEIFLPDVGDGTHYKFEICGADGRWHRKADPMASRAERPPATASVIYTSRYEWSDAEWLSSRARRQSVGQPVSVYEVHLGSWRPGLSYAQLAEELTEYVTEPGLHPRGVPAGGRAPVRRVVGLPGHLVLRADGPVRQPGRVPPPGGPAAPGRHRGDPGLGPGPLPARRAGRWPGSTARRCTSTPIRAAASTRTGAR